MTLTVKDIINLYALFELILALGRFRWMPNKTVDFNLKGLNDLPRIKNALTLLEY